MKKYLMKIKVNMLIVLIISLLGGMAGSYFFNNRWLGLIVAIPLCALYIYQVYQVQADYREQHTKKKHTRLSRVDFPAPFSPLNAHFCPRITVQSSSFKIVRSP